jgi:hypothetical protein
VIWRNSNNHIVKQVVFCRNSRFKPYFPNEKEELEKLEYGFVYKAKAIDRVQKVLYYRHTDLSKLSPKK